MANQFGGLLLASAVIPLLVLAPIYSKESAVFDQEIPCFRSDLMAVVRARNAHHRCFLRASIRNDRALNCGHSSASSATTSSEWRQRQRR
jgi:hypothetical protein